MNEQDLYERAKRKVYRPLPHIESLHGWKLNTEQCFFHITGRDRSDWSGHQCEHKPKYYIGQFQFCTRHAKELSPTLEGLTKFTRATTLFASKYVQVNAEKFDNP
jgi:hypothetical protein